VVISLAWSVANRTDGRIYDEDLALIPASASRSGQLAKSGLWAGVAYYWQIAEFEETQTTRADLAHLDGQRRKARDRKRAERARRVPHDVAGDVTSDSTRTGQDRRTKGKRYMRRTSLRPAARHGCSTCWDHAYMKAGS
jgi:hypothetical protein